MLKTMISLNQAKKQSRKTKGRMFSIDSILKFPKQSVKSGKYLNANSEIPYWAQYFNALSGIGSFILGIGLSLFSIFLTIKASRTATKVEKMDSLLTQQVSIINQQVSMIERLDTIQNGIRSTLKALQYQVNTIQNQTNFIKNSASPNVEYVGMSVYKISDVKNNAQNVEQRFKNFGGRTAIDFNAKELYLLPASDTFRFGWSNALIIPTGTILGPNQEITNNYWVSSEVTDMLTGMVRYMTITYRDELTKRSFMKHVYSTFRKGRSGIEAVTIFDISEINKMNTIVKKLEKIKALYPTNGKANIISSKKHE